MIILTSINQSIDGPQRILSYFRIIKLDDCSRYFSPGYTEQLLEKVDRFAPNRSDYEKFFQNATQAAANNAQTDKSRADVTELPAASA